MWAYSIRRLFMALPVLVGISVLVFLMISLIPGDPASAILGPYASADNVAQLRAQLGLDQPLVQQYALWIQGLAQGDFGWSYSLSRPVFAEITERYFPTLLLAGSALLLCAVFGIIAGVIAAVRQYGWQDQLITLIVLVGISTPSFFLGLLLILWFSVGLGWFPSGGMYSLFGAEDWRDLLHHLVLPAVTLAVVATAVLARLTRANMLEVLRQDYIRTARAKGLSERSVILRHALRNAAVNVIPILGIQAGFVFGGAVYIETVFQWPGIGRMLVDAIATRDILLVQGGVLLVAVTYVLINLLTDLVQVALDPRIRGAA